MSISRVHGVSQDVIYKDQEKMTKIQTLVDKLQDGYHTKSIINDLRKKDISSTFSEASRRTIKELGNIEFFELGEIAKKVQCPSCFMYSKEGTVYCLCGICLVNSLEQTEKIENRWEIISNPLYFIKEGHLGERHGPEQWQYDHWKARDATKGFITINIKFFATWPERSRYHNMLVLRFKDVKNQERCQIETILNLQPDHLLS